jgi:site-specific recombinase XerD
MALPSYGNDALGEDDEAILRELEASLGRLEVFASQAWAENTVRAYESDWQHFTAWCEKHGRRFLPAASETVGLYLGAIVDEYSLATIERRLAAVSSVHKEHNYESPASVSSGPLRKIWKGIVREKTRRQDQAEPLMVEDLRRIVQHLPREESGELTIQSLRDRAILLVGWAGALRRSELTGLTVSDLEFLSGRGVNLYIRKSKTDQEGGGLIKGLPYGAHAETCPVTALRTWMKRADIQSVRLRHP